MDKKSRSPLIFVVMPFADEFKDIYELGIKSACKDAGADCERVDEQTFLENIPDRIYGEIEKADLIIAEMSGRNPNVFYEVGYAHGLGKPVILVTRQAGDIPFDLRHYPHIVHEGKIRELKAELHKKVLNCIEHPELLKSRRGRWVSADADSAVDEQITNYLKANGYTRMSFERIATLMGIPEKQVRKLIQSCPTKFRFALVKGKKPGIALLENG